MLIFVKYKIFILTLAISVSLRAQDYFSFLRSSKINVILENGKPKIFSGGHDEKYFMTEGLGTSEEYKLRLKNPEPLYAEVLASVIADIMQVPHARVLPVLVRRGEANLPLSDDAKRLDSLSPFMGLAGNKGELFPANLQKKVMLEKFDSHLTDDQIIDLIKVILFNGLIGNHDVQFLNGKDGNIVFGRNFKSS